MPPYRSLVERFHSYIPDADLDECWPWLGSRTAQGYGQLGGERRHPRAVYAHRLMWELTYGPIPPGLHICHRCDNPPCVNPTHLFPGTDHDNLMDMAAKGRGHGPHFLGEMHPMALLTAEQVIEIRQRVVAGEAQARVARDFPVTRDAVWRIIHRKVWKHVA